MGKKALIAMSGGVDSSGGRLSDEGGGIRLYWRNHEIIR